MRICFLPIDNRPVCYSLAKDIAELASSLELLIPERKYLGDLTKSADIEALTEWIKNIENADGIILALDTLVYGGLIPSRRSKETLEELLERTAEIKEILKSKNAKIYAFSSIMRISNNNFNEEEKEYWKDYGKKIFEYSYNLNKFGSAQTEVPKEILEDYLNTRKRNFEINKLYLEWQKEGLFDTLVFSKDDCAEFGLNVAEAKELEALGGFTKTGADEIPLSLLSRAIKKELKVFVEYTEPDCKNLISNYEDVSIENSVKGQLELGGFEYTETKRNADLILIVNNFREKQGELVMGWKTEPFNKGFTPPDKPFAIADVRFANGADNEFVKKLLPKLRENENFYGYSGWNTSANTLGSLLAGVKARFLQNKYNKEAFKKLQVIRFLDDWAYQANVREKIEKPCDISEQMKPYEECLSEIFNTNFSAEYLYPWSRKFEIEVKLS